MQYFFLPSLSHSWAIFRMMHQDQLYSNIDSENDNDMFVFKYSNI